VTYQVQPYDIVGLSRNATGAADAFSASFRYVLVSFWTVPFSIVSPLFNFNFVNSPAPPNGFSFYIQNNTCFLTAFDDLGNVIGGDTYTGAPLGISTIANVLVSMDSATSTTQIYVNDVALTRTVHTWPSPGAMALGAGSQFQITTNVSGEACLGDVYVALPASFYDLSIQANRRKFIDGSGNPVDLGANGSLPTGSQPEVFLHTAVGGTFAAFLANLGTTGALTTAGSASACPPIPTVDPPGVPSVSCGDVHTSSSFTAAWTAGGGGDPTSYDLQWRKVGTVPFTTVSDLPASPTSYLVTGLEAATTYEFKVQAENSSGSSGYSDLMQCTTENNILTVPVARTLHRWRGQVGLNWKGMALVGDFASNVVGLSDFANFTEYDQPMQFLITTPPIHDDRRRIFFQNFEIEVQAGDGLPDGDAPVMSLEWSKDGGVTWLPLQLPRSMGSVGQYIKRLRWVNLGNARTWIFRLTCTDPVRRYIIGTYTDSFKGNG